jgi:hypothetical protein
MSIRPVESDYADAVAFQFALCEYAGAVARENKAAMAFEDKFPVGIPNRHFLDTRAGDKLTARERWVRDADTPHDFHAKNPGLAARVKSADYFAQFGVKVGGL